MPRKNHGISPWFTLVILVFWSQGLEIPTLAHSVSQGPCKLFDHVSHITCGSKWFVSTKLKLQLDTQWYLDLWYITLHNHVIHNHVSKFLYPITMYPISPVSGIVCELGPHKFASRASGLDPSIPRWATHWGVTGLIVLGSRNCLVVIFYGYQWGYHSIHGTYSLTYHW